MVVSAMSPRRLLGASSTQVEPESPGPPPLAVRHSRRSASGARSPLDTFSDVRCPFSPLPRAEWFDHPRVPDPNGVGVWERKEREDQGRRTQVKANQHRFSDADDSGAGPLVPAPGLASLISGSKPDGRGAHRKDLNAARTSLVKRSGSCHAAK